MSRNILPAILSTPEALRPDDTNDTTLVYYIDLVMYVELFDCIDDIMRKKGYIRSKTSAKHGVFYIKNKGFRRFIPFYHRIYDPSHKL